MTPTFGPHDHLEASEDAPVQAGVYRVVGVDDDGVTLLALTDGSGRRRHTGRIERLDHEAAAELAPASDPDAGLGRLRQVPKAYAARPVLSAVAVAGVAAGLLARLGVPGLPPDLAETALLGGAAFLGALAVSALR